MILGQSKRVFCSPTEEASKLLVHFQMVLSDWVWFDEIKADFKTVLCVSQKSPKKPLSLDFQIILFLHFQIDK